MTDNAPAIATDATPPQDVVMRALLQLLSGTRPTGATPDESKTIRAVHLDDYEGKEKLKLLVWKHRLHSTFTAYAVPASRHLALACAHLKGPAEQWYMQQVLADKQPTSLEELFSQLQERFVPVASEDDVRYKIDTLMCKSDGDISDYINKFEALRIQLPARDKLDTVWAFKKGLRRLTELKLSLAAIHDLEKAYLMAREREFAHRQNKQAGELPRTQQSGKPGYNRDRGHDSRTDRHHGGGKQKNKWKRKFDKPDRREQHGGDRRPNDGQRPHKSFHKGGNGGNDRKFKGKSYPKGPNKSAGSGGPRHDGGTQASA